MIASIASRYKSFHSVLIWSLFAVASSSFGAEIQEPASNQNTKKVASSEPITIGLIDGESTEDMSVVTVRLSTKPTFAKLEIQDHGTFLQLLLPGTITANPGHFYDGNSPVIKKIAVFQTTQTEAAIRLFLTEDAAAVKSATEAAVMDSRIVITTDHRELKKLLAAQPLVANSDANTIAPQNLGASSLATKGASAPAIQPTVAQPKKDPFNYKDKLVEITIFAAVMFFLLILAVSIKPLLRKRQMHIQGDAFVSMKVLSNLNLAPRQKLSLIQVGSEQFLVSVSPTKIEFISKVGDTSHKSFNSAPRPILAANDPSIHAITARNGTQAQLPQQKRALRDSEPSRIEKTGPILEPAHREAKESAPTPSPRMRPGRKSQNSIQVQISDEGIKDLRSQNKSNAEGPAGSIDDVTRMIREKLRNLPSI